ncbi:hypothetical protein [Pelagibius sp.]|uniref:DUF7079 family protein n=1 Tax=Pelagibius sp. TaxID=1931238 RepID=UPI00261A33E2|nr:hypothetical protein [Pelagibius sp.]
MTLLPPESDIDNRLPVWVACSELCLDTELAAPDFQRIARVCAASPYSGGDLDRIMFAEVWPAFGVNLLSVAGEWAGWDETFVKERVLQRQRRRWRLPWWLDPVARSLRRDWAVVRKHVDAIRAPSGPAASDRDP